MVRGLARGVSLNRDFQSLKSEATAWVVRLTSGAATTEDAEALRRWRALSPDHDRAFREAARLWKALGGEKTLAPRRLTRRVVMLSGSLAATTLVAAYGLSEIGLLPSLDALTADHATAIGEQRVVTLPDGSRATLDGGSSLTLAFSDAERRLTLNAGAAVFDVATMSARPFVVTAGTGATTATGTSFAVQHGATDVSVACIEGRIEVNCLGSMDLAAGEAVRYSAEGLGERSVSDGATAGAWRRGLLTFSGRRLSDVVADLNRHRRGRVVIARRGVGARRVSGVFHLDRPDEILAHLEATLDLVRYDLVGGIVLLR